MKAVIASVALFGAAVSALTSASGSGIIINNCDYAVGLDNTPAAGEGATGESRTLQKGDSYSTHWTGLEGHHDGWSMKLRPANTDASSRCMQYEYTYQPTNPSTPDIIWFDISYVDGDPFDGNWSLSSNNATCHALLHHEAYAYSTDDARGMQKPCDCTADITLVLCPSSSSSSSSSGGGLLGGLLSGAASVVSNIVSDVVSPLTSAAAQSPTSVYVAPTTTAAPVPSTTSVYVAPAAPTTTAAPTTAAPTTAAPPAPTAAPAPPTQQAPPPAPSQSYVAAQHDYNGPELYSAPQPTTFATQYAQKTYGHTVVEIETAWVTEVVTVDVPAATEYVVRRHARHVHHAAHNA
jgi:hypothetical protein